MHEELVHVHRGLVHVHEGLVHIHEGLAHVHEGLVHVHQGLVHMRRVPVRMIFNQKAEKNDDRSVPGNPARQRGNRDVFIHFSLYQNEI
jgi:hypothetical protein